MLVRIISMVIAGVIIVYLVRWIDNFSPGIANKSCLQCKPNTPICFPLQPMRTFSNSKTRKPQKLFISYLRFFVVIPLRFERKTHALEGRCSIQLSYGTSLNCGAKVRFLRILQILYHLFRYLCTKGSFAI